MLICPKCGRSSDDVPFIEAFCIDCHPFDVKLPKKVTIQHCRKCGKMRLAGEWVPFSRKKIAEYVISKCKGDFTSGEFNIESSEATFILEKGGHKTSIRRTISFEIVPVTCRVCSRISGGYFEAIIQLRGDRLKIRRAVDRLIRLLSKKTFITKEEEKHGGIDLFVGSSKAVLETMREHGYKPLITRKLIGRREGKRLFRVTFALRFE